MTATGPRWQQLLDMSGDDADEAFEELERRLTYCSLSDLAREQATRDQLSSWPVLPEQPADTDPEARP